MTLCPVALAVHCTGCPIVNVCRAKRVLGDYGTYVPPPETGAKPADDGATAKVDGDHK